MSQGWAWVVTCQKGLGGRGYRVQKKGRIWPKWKRRGGRLSCIVGGREEGVEAEMCGEKGGHSVGGEVRSEGS